MDFGKLPLAAMMARKIAWLTRRSEILAQNVANADTPGYRAQDLKETSFGALVARESHGPRNARYATLTHAKHMAGPPGTKVSYRVVDEPDIREPTISGNTVSMEQQMQHLGETQMAYQMVIDLYRKQLGMFRTALGRGN